MYVPKHFAVDDPGLVNETMRAYPLATLVTSGAGGLMANHVPLAFVPERSDGASSSVLRGHLSRANAQWREIQSGTEILAIFTGPDAYISPVVYPSVRETGEVVPTWNYIVVHAYGIGRTFDDPNLLHDLVTEQTDVRESERARTSAEANEPWRVTDAPRAYVDALLRGIVGFEISLTRVVAKWKVGQDERPADLRAAGRYLAESNGENVRALGRIMLHGEI